MLKNAVRLERTGKPDLEFKGNEVASTTSNPTGSKKRWTELKVFKTTGGRYVTQILGLSDMEGERTRSTVSVIDDLDDLPNILCFGDLAKQIYKKLSLLFSDHL